MNLRGTWGGHGGQLEEGREECGNDVNTAFLHDIIKNLNEKASRLES